MMQALYVAALIYLDAAPPGGTPAPAPKVASPTSLAPDDPAAIRCRSILVTGSLVRRERICRTNAEWRTSRDQQNRDADDLITRSRSGMNGN